MKIMQADLASTYERFDSNKTVDFINTHGCINTISLFMILLVAHSLVTSCCIMVCKIDFQTIVSEFNFLEIPHTSDHASQLILA